MQLQLLLTTISVCALSGSRALEWISSPTFANGTKVQVCVGDTIVLPWKFNTTVSDHVIDIEWYFGSEGMQDRPLAIYVMDTLVVAEDFMHVVEFLPNSGILLPGANLSDSGYYSVVVYVRGNGIAYSQTAFVQVNDAPLTKYGDLRAYVLTDTAFQELNGNRERHMQLGCGDFLSLGYPPVSVVWTTPSKSIVNSTSYRNGTFILVLPNPLEGGDYYCQLDGTSTAELCLQSNTSFLRTAVNVSNVDLRFILLEENVKELQAGDLLITNHLDNITGEIMDINKDFTDTMDSFGEEVRNMTRMVEDLFIEKELLTHQIKNIRNTDENITETVKDMQIENKQLKADLEELEMENQNISRLVSDLQSANTFLRGEVDSLRQANQNITSMVRDIQVQNEHRLQETNDRIVTLQLAFQDSLRRPRTCLEVKEYDDISGPHTLYLFGGKTVDVYCEQTTDGGGWTVVQRRQDGSVNFYRSWAEYEIGFGNLSTEFWIGLSNLYLLTNNQNYSIRIDLQDFDDNVSYATYDVFHIRGAVDNYRLDISKYNGTAGDCLGPHTNKTFSAYDNDNDEIDYNCAVDRHGGWWYGNCAVSNLNGMYKPDGAPGANGTVWTCWSTNSLRRTEMKIRPQI